MTYTVPKSHLPQEDDWPIPAPTAAGDGYTPVPPTTIDAPYTHTGLQPTAAMASAPSTSMSYPTTAVSASVGARAAVGKRTTRTAAADPVSHVQEARQVIRAQYPAAVEPTSHVEEARQVIRDATPPPVFRSGEIDRGAMFGGGAGGQRPGETDRNPVGVARRDPRFPTYSRASGAGGSAGRRRLGLRKRRSRRGR